MNGKGTLGKNIHSRLRRVTPKTWVLIAVGAGTALVGTGLVAFRAGTQPPTRRRNRRAGGQHGSEAWLVGTGDRPFRARRNASRGHSSGAGLSHRGQP